MTKCYGAARVNNNVPQTVGDVDTSLADTLANLDIYMTKNRTTRKTFLIYCGMCVGMLSFSNVRGLFAGVISVATSVYLHTMI